MHLPDRITTETLVILVKVHINSDIGTAVMGRFKVCYTAARNPKGATNCNYYNNMEQCELETILILKVKYLNEFYVSLVNCY